MSERSGSDELKTRPARDYRSVGQEPKAKKVKGSKERWFELTTQNMRQRGTAHVARVVCCSITQIIHSVVTDCTKKQRKITMHHFSQNDCHGPGNGRVK